MSFNFSYIKRFFRIIIALFALLLISFLDHRMGHTLEFTLVFVLPIIYVCWKENLIWSLVISIFAGFFWAFVAIADKHGISTTFAFYWNITVRPIFFIGVTFVFHKLKNSLKKEREIALFKSNMISSISHEFNNLLSGMNLTTTLLEEGEEKMSEERLTLYKIHRHSYSVMKRQIKVFLNNSRLESGKIKPDIKKTEIRAIINNSTSYLLPVAYEKNIAIEKHFPEKPIPVNCDIDLMNLAISNLIANAIKYSPKDKNIHVSVKQINKDDVEIAVEDNGIGIDKEDFAKIFSGYYRTKESVAHATGFGIGLKLTKDIIELHNSKLKVESEKGKGSKFYFTLPLHKDIN